ncbi:hypothetical protein AR687_15815 [Flavobacteriaceae bacterium CRH]|nr:hypothetical protein AR687_15815 [Flavobacteriaceae bacterium CRH]
MSQNYNYFICFLISVLFTSCTHDELQTENENANLNRIKQDLDLKKFSNVNISENVEINWEKIDKTKKDNFTIYEVSANEKKASTLQSDFLQEKLKYQIISIESEGQLYSYFVEVYTNKESKIYPETITKLNDFSGTLNVFLFNGENLGSVAIYNGSARNISKNNNLNILTESINAFITKSDATNKIPQCGGNYTVIIDQSISRYDVWTVGDKIIAINYVGTTTTRTSTIMAYPCDGSYSKEDIINQRLELYNFKTSSGGTNGEIAAPQIFNELTGKAKCLNDLLTKNGDSFVQKILINFEGKNSEFDIKIVSVDKITSKDATGNIVEINGRTLAEKGKREILIEISTSKTNENSALDIVRTILHEYIHADLHSKTFTKEFPEAADFAKVLKMYENHHGVMAALYINSMKTALKEFHKTVLIDDYNKYIAYYGETPSDAFYEALAWGGLKFENVKAWTDLTDDKKAAIENLASRATKLSKMVPCVD